MANIKSRLLIRGVIPLIFFLSIAVLWNIASQRVVLPDQLMGVLRPQPKLLKSFKLVDQNGVLINEQIFKGKWSFVFFGYTSCPDICPTTLNVLNAVVNQLEKKDAQVVFVSVDPERDTTDKLAEYMTFFNKDFMGVSGDKKNIDNLVKQFSAGYMMEKETSPGQYLVGHTSAIFLVDPKIRLVASFSQPHNPKTIVSQYEKVRAYISK